jgi:hypothetical protein
MTEVLIAPRAPWQNPFAERVIGSNKPSTTTAPIGAKCKRQRPDAS